MCMMYAYNDWSHYCIIVGSGFIIISSFWIRLEYVYVCRFYSMHGQIKHKIEYRVIEQLSNVVFFADLSWVSTLIFFTSCSTNEIVNKFGSIYTNSERDDSQVYHPKELAVPFLQSFGRLNNSTSAFHSGFQGTSHERGTIIIIWKVFTHILTSSGNSLYSSTFSLSSLCNLLELHHDKMHKNFINYFY